MLPKLRWLPCLLAPLAAVVACSEIAGLGSPVTAAMDGGGPGMSIDVGTAGDASDGGGGGDDGDAKEKNDTGASDAPDAATDVSAAPPVDGGPGSLDTTFGDGGTLFVSGGAPYGITVGPHGLAVDATGNLVYCGGIYSGGYFDYIVLLGRFLKDGTPDPSFNLVGQLTDAVLGSGYLSVCYAVALRADGAIVATGIEGPDVANPNDQMYQMLAARFTGTGGKDTTFGGGTGYAIVDSGVSSSANALVLQSDDSLVIGGSNMIGGANGSEPALAAIAADGTVQPTFGAPNDAGAGSLDLVDGDAGAITQLLPRAAGYLASLESTEFLVLGVTPGGTIDPTYGNGGQASLALADPLTAGAVDMIVQPTNGATVCAGSTVHSIDLARFTANGQLDTSFGASGQPGHATAKTTQSLTAQAMAMLPDGSFAVALLGSQGVAGVVHFTPNGSLDMGFGQAGFSIFPAPASTNSEAIAVDASGYIYLALGEDDGMQIMRMTP